MKKTILSAAILLASTIGFTTMAQTPAPGNSATQTESSKCCKGKQMSRPNPFEGLNLTEQQKSELKAIAPVKPERKDKATQANAGKCKKSKDCKNDSTMTKADKQKMRAERHQKMLQNRRDYLAKVKNILTPEQYVQFLENSYVDKTFKNGGKHGHMAKSKGKHKGGKMKASPNQAQRQ